MSYQSNYVHVEGDLTPSVSVAMKAVCEECGHTTLVPITNVIQEIPKPVRTPPTIPDAVRDRFHLWYSDGSPMEPVLFDTDRVWWNPSPPEDEPYYAIFNAGTNYLLVLKYVSGDWADFTSEIAPGPTYSLMWKMSLPLRDLSRKRRSELP